MSDPKTDAIPNPSSVPRGLAIAELPEVSYFQRALQIAEDDGLGLTRANVHRVESVWSIDDGDMFLLGLVLSLRSGARVCLHYCFDFPDDEEEVEVLPMGDERYPTKKGSGVEWSDDVGELNRLLMS